MAREVGDDAPVGVRFHLERCERCATLAERYREGVSALARDTASPSPRLPAAAAVIAAAQGERGLRRPWVFTAVAAAVAALATVVALSVAGGEPELDAPSPPVAETPTRPETSAPSPSLAEAPEAPEVARPELEGIALRTTDAPVELVDPAVATVTVERGSDVAVPTWSGEAAEVALRSGGVSVSVRPRVGEQRFTVATSELVATVVGTAFSVTRSPLDGTRVAVREGVVYVEVRGGGAVTLVAGDVIVVAPAGRAPVAPERAAEPEEQVASASDEATRPRIEAGPIAPRVQAARRLLAQGRAEEAIAALRALSPVATADRASVAALLGDAYAVAGRMAAARDAYADAARLGEGAIAAGALADLARVELALGDDAAAREAWRRLLAVAPDGPLAPRALAGLNDDEALLERYPESREATAALLRIGGGHLDAGRWSEAAALFSAHLDSRRPARREAALVGLMRARLGEGRRDAVRALIDRYDQGFPDGARRAEVDRIRAAVGD